jgi:hypothetical protein
MAIESDLQGWVPPSGAKVALSIASDPFEVLEILADSPAGVRVILLWKGDDDLSQGTPIGIVDNHLEITISHNRGLKVRSGQSLYQSSATRPSLIALLDSLRARLRSLGFMEDDGSISPMEYKGCDPVVTPEGLRLDAYTLRFQVTGALTVVPDRVAVLPDLTIP